MKNQALIVIDMQEGFRYKESEAIIPAIIDVLKTFEGVCVFTQFFDVPGSLFERQLHWSKFQNLIYQPIMEEFEVFNHETVKHCTYGVMSDDLKKILINHSIQKVFLCGVYTDVSILKTAMDLFDMGYEVFVLKDCCASVHKMIKSNLHESGLESISHIIGKDHII